MCSMKLAAEYINSRLSLSLSLNHRFTPYYCVSLYGKGRHRRHKASLNFGDCMTFAVAKLSGEALLCTGSDFAKTDLQLA